MPGLVSRLNGGVQRSERVRVYQDGIYSFCYHVLNLLDLAGGAPRRVRDDVVLESSTGLQLVSLRAELGHHLSAPRVPAERIAQSNHVGRLLHGNHIRLG